MPRKNEPVSEHPHISEYLTVKEAANLLGVSPRTVYGYIEADKLPGSSIGNTTVVLAADVASFQRSAPGRKREQAPRWHRPPVQNGRYITTIRVRTRPGQQKCLEHKLAELRRTGRHPFPGTSARYVAGNQDDEGEVLIILIWQAVIMPPKQERETALAALATELAEVLDWETVVQTHGQVIFHAQ